MLGRMTDQRHSSQTAGVLLTLTAAVSVGTLGPVAAVAYDAGLAPATLSALRAAIGASVLFAVILIGRRPRASLATLPRRQVAMLVTAVLVNGLMNLALFLAFGAMSVALVMVLFYLYPGITAVGAAALGRERLTPIRVAALALAGLGLILVLGDRLASGGQAAPIGIVLACAAAIGHAAYFLLVRDGFPDVPSVNATAWVLAGGVLISGTAAVVAEGLGISGGWLTSQTAWLAVLVAGTVGAAFPKVLIMHGVRTIGSTRAALVMLMEPVTAVVVAAIALNQTLSATSAVGAIAILVAAAVVQRPDPAATAMAASR